MLWKQFKEFVSEHHVGQALHQMTVFKCSCSMYVSASETGILYVVISYCDDAACGTTAFALAGNSGRHR
jgi:hypothetical protein